MSNEQIFIELCGRMGERWIANMLVTALEVRADRSATAEEHLTLTDISCAAVEVREALRMLDEARVNPARDSVIVARR